MLRKNWPGWLVLGTAAFVLLLDQLSKQWIERNLPLGKSIVLLPALRDFFTITHFTNTGAAFGLFRDQGILFVIIPIVIVVAIIVYSRHLPHELWLVRLSLGMQLGGALGNLTDRLRQGYVTDFIYFHFWPAFNVADSAIVVGVILLGWILLREGDSGPHEEHVDTEPGGQQAA